MFSYLYLVWISTMRQYKPIWPIKPLFSVFFAPLTWELIVCPTCFSSAPFRLLSNQRKGWRTWKNPQSEIYIFKLFFLYKKNYFIKPMFIWFTVTLTCVALLFTKRPNTDAMLPLGAAGITWMSLVGEKKTKPSK